VVSDLDFDTGNKTGLAALLTPEGVLSFSSGMVYGTDLVQDTTYLDICTKMLEKDFVARGRSVYNTTLEFKVFESLYEVYSIFWHVHPLFENCYQAPDTATDILLERFND